MIYLKNTSTLYWKCLATSTGLLFRRLHLSWQLNFFSSLSLSPRLFNLLMIYGSSSHLRSAHDNVRNYVGIPNCLIVASISYKNCFQLLMFLCLNSRMKMHCPLQQTFLLFLLFLFKITFNCFCCECTWFNFVHNKVYRGTQMVLLIYRPGKKVI